MMWDTHTYTPYIRFVLMTMSFSFVYSYVYQKGNGNVLILILFHGSNNAAHAIFYLFYDELPASAQYLYWIYVAVNVISAVIVFVLMNRKQNHKELPSIDA